MPWWLVVAQTVALAGHVPALWVARNVDNQPDMWAAALLSLVVAAVGGLIIVGLIGIGVTRHRSVTISSMMLLAFWYWPSLARPVGPASALLVGLTITAMLVAMGVVFADSRLVRVVLAAGSITTLVVGLAMVLLRQADEGAAHVSTGSETQFEPTVAVLPDLYVVVFDGMARGDVMAEMYGHDPADFHRWLESEGFSIAEEATSNYSITHFSVASMFEMGYPMTGDEPVTRADTAALQPILSGDNTFVRQLREAGYSYVHGGHGWWGTRCGELVDLCLGTPVLEQTSFELLSGSALGDFIYPRTGDPGTAATLARLEQFGRWEEVTGKTGGAPQLVFLHMGVPHPPLFLDDRCKPRPDPILDGRHVNGYPSLPEEVMEVRRAAYVDQVECVQVLAEAIVAAADENAVIAFVSDHGPDSLGQLGREASDLGRRDLWERMSILAATRLPSQCQDRVPDDLSLVNLLPIVANCTLGTDIPLRDDRYFVAPATGWNVPLLEVEDPDIGND